MHLKHISHILSMLLIMAGVMVIPVEQFRTSPIV
jgi:hypothetical protein